MSDDHHPGAETAGKSRPAATVAAVRAAVAGHAPDFLADLRDWVSIPSISADSRHHADVVESARWLAEALRRDGWPLVEVWDTTSAGPMLPAVHACWPAEDPDAPVVLVYAHHDVQPVDPVTAWDHPPFEAVLVGDELFGRGVSDDKGQVLMHLLALRAHLDATGRTAPAVTVKLLVEGEEESASPNLARLLADHADALACDLVVVSDTQLLGRDTPSVCVGMRGLADAEVVFHGAASDLHSGQFGGAVVNPAVALAKLLAALHDDDGRVAIPGFYDDVRDPDPAERAAFARLPFDEAAWLAGPGAGASAWGEAGWSTLERLWVRPTVEVNGVHSGYTGPGVKTVVPRQATAKLTFRLVPGQRVARVLDLLRDFVAARTPHGVRSEVRTGRGGFDPAVVEPGDPATGAVVDALRMVFDHDIVPARSGGSGPAALLTDALGAPLVFLGAGLSGDHVHAPNERVAVPLLHRGAEAAAVLWDLLPGRLARAGGGTEEHTA
ncbi:M20/M25/M40 family metallo-hydrolase [Streptoalloteichus hindustanus]|uniref:Acetylornithine deacetylase/Succinyl-diaminopimelate desuccinylase n=1 Tax=Streptoalloteichus hindustanus TaxID=2017 RepID=A0A1M5J9Y6_STRHI|nr:M20/M25/M40 family metallo-hydrolase [Streptoalloteichus hindustanus]SHG37129.1 Acetylornithine deacetylase/Succinyl-diaminopimelate desuccinylase [Streptoalloteichus hindustanus]